MDKDDVLAIKVCIGVGITALILVIGGFWGVGALNRVYNVWAERKAGEAELARAESNRQIKVLEAKAQEDSAKYLAQAEIARAEGVAKANIIIGDSLKGNEGYLRYLWISGLSENQNKVIYVPTEANLPILEAGHR